jgi:hypothetical protein
MTKKKPLPHLPAGRPSEYDPSFCERVIKYGKKGKSRTWMAAELGCVRQSLYTWEQIHPEFMDAMAKAAAFSQQWWEDAGQDGMKAQGFSAAIWSRSMSARFPEEWREKQSHQHTGANDGPIPVQMNLSKANDAELAALASLFGTVASVASGDPATDSSGNSEA